MKKIFRMMSLCMLVTALCAGFVACGDDDDTSPSNLKTNVLYATFADGKKAEIEIVGIGGNALNPMSSEENSFTFFDGPCDVHLECNFKTGKGTGDIILVDERALTQEERDLAVEFMQVGGQFSATNCRYEKGILYFHIEGAGEGLKAGTQETVNCTFKADVKQTGQIYYPEN